MSAQDHQLESVVRAIVADVVRRRSAGEDLPDKAVLEGHPTVPSDALGRALERLRRIGLAQLDVTRTHVPLSSDVVRVVDTPSDWSNDSRASSAEQVLPESVGRYAPLAVLGSGAFGTVYRAYDPQHDCSVALKLSKRAIHTQQDESNFFREARAAAQLDHPGIVHVRDSGRDGDRFFIVSDYIDGITLEEMIAGGAVPIDATVKIAIAICDALHQAHEKRVVHRDLKPANVIIDRAGKPRIMDFGLAKRIDNDATQTADGHVIGTIAYMSPQQAEGTNSLVDGRSDIYSIGVIMFEMLTGERPFRGTPVMVHRQVLYDEAPSLRLLNDRIPRDLETLVLRCLEKAPEQRFADAAELKDELLRFKSGEPIKSRPISSPERLWRWSRRRPATAGLVLAVGMLVITAMTAGAREIYTQRRAKAQLSENLLTTAELYGRRGEWQKALSQIEAAEAFGHDDPVRLRIARVKALEALNRVEDSRIAIDALAAQQDLGDHFAEVTYLQAVSLQSRGERDQALAMLREASEANALVPSDAEIVAGLMAKDSPTALQHFERSLELDPFSHEAHKLVSFALSMAGEDIEALERLRVARLIYPDDPNFPLLAAFILGKRGKTDQALQLLSSNACQQLRPELLSAYATIVKNFPALTQATMQLWDFEQSAAYEGLLSAESSAAAAIQQAVRDIGHYGDTTNGQGGVVDLLESKGPACYEKACEPLLDLASLRTIGFLTRGVGDTARIDELIARLDESASLHPDSFFDFSRGRLLYERGRLGEASDALERASQRKSLLGEFAAVAAYAGARCEYERFKQHEVTSLGRAASFIDMRLSKGDISTQHAAVLLNIAMAAGQFDLARTLAHHLDGASTRSDDWRLRLAEIEVQDKEFLAAVQILDEAPFRGETAAGAESLRAKCVAGLRKIAETFDGGTPSNEGAPGETGESGE